MRDLIALDLPGGPGFVDELRRVWDDGDAVVVVDQRWSSSLKADLLDGLGATSVVTAAGRTPLAGGRPVDDGDAAVVATSGSTGTPKGAMLTHDAIAASADATSRRLDAGADDHWLACLPLAHIGGLSVIFRALHTGSALTVLDRFDPDRVAASGANLVSLVATALQRIDPTVFRTIVLGGSRPPADRPPNSVTTYGMTESGSGVVYDGRPLDRVEVRIVDGEIHLRGPMMLRCYRNGIDPKDSDGWYPTGDLGAMGTDGVLRVDGRSDDVIISGGENVWPEPVEVALRSSPWVDDVAIVGERDPEWGQRVVAVVVPADTDRLPSLQQLREHVAETLPRYCAPRAVRFATHLPRTSLGKLKRSDVLRPGQ